MNSQTKVYFATFYLLTGLAMINIEATAQVNPLMASKNNATTNNNITWANSSITWANNIDTLISRYSQFTELYSPEKLFIHTDKSNYVAGELIWFRGYLTSKSQSAIIPESNFIYVELYRDTLISRVKIKRTESGFEGNLQLGHDLKSGNYTIRAYTQWMLNYPSDYLFYKQVFVVNPTKKDIDNLEQNSTAPLSDIIFFPESGRYFSDRFSIIAFKTFDSLGRGTCAIAELYNSKDSLIGSYTTEHNGMGWFRFYPISEESYYVIAHERSQDPSIEYKFEQIYESGKTLASNNNAIQPTKSIRKPLPPPSQTGAVINLVRRENKLKGDPKLLISTSLIEDLNNSLPQICFLIIHDGTNIYHSETLTFSNKSDTPSEKTIILNENELPQGINHILITDANSNIIAERLFFVYPRNQATISLTTSGNSSDIVSTVNETTGKREKLTYKFKIKDTFNNPIAGNFSVSVTDSFLAPANLSGDNLVSYMHLSSELKGVIENPAFYFEKSSSDSLDWNLKKRAMDLLMMVQGWRYYNLPAIFNNPHYLTIDQTKDKKDKKNSNKESSNSAFYPKELVQIIEGRASGLFRNTKRATISILAPSIKLAVSENLIKSGNFTVTDIDFPDSTNFIISCMGKEQQKGYYIDTKEFRFPPIKFVDFPRKVGKKIDEDAIDFYLSIYHNTGGELITILNSAVVTASPKITPKNNPSPFNQAFDRRQFRERSDLDMYEGMSLLDYIVSSFPGLTYGPTGEDGLRSIQSTRSSNILGDPGVPVAFVNLSRVQSTGDLDMYSVDDIENVAFLKGNDGHLFMTLSGVILVTLRTSLDKNARGVERNYNTKLYTPLGWQKPSKFYSPNYSLKSDRDAVTFDTRSTLYWNPYVTTDSNGNAQISFYSTDRLTRLNINVQGVTQDGRYFILE